MTLLESWAVGTPVVAARVGAAQNLIEEGVTGALYNATDSAELADRVRSLHYQPDLAIRISLSAQRYALTEFGAQANFDQLIKIYRGITYFRQV